MRVVTADQITAALEGVAVREMVGGSDMAGWRWHRSMAWHSDQSSRTIARFCMMMGEPVDDTLTGDLFGALVNRVAELEKVVFEGRTV